MFAEGFCCSITALVNIWLTIVPWRNTIYRTLKSNYLSTTEIVGQKIVIETESCFITALEQIPTDKLQNLGENLLRGVNAVQVAKVMANPILTLVVQVVHRWSDVHILLATR